MLELSDHESNKQTNKQTMIRALLEKDNMQEADV